MKKLKENRILSFLIITIIYILATILGILAYNLFYYAWWVNLLIADVFASTFVFLFSLIFNNASVYDPYWSVQPPVILICFAVRNNITIFEVLLIIVVCFWAIRLTLNWAYTFKNLNHQDWRYTKLKQKTKKLYPLINYLGIHLVPTFVVYCFTLPGVFAIINGLELSLLSIPFLCVSLGGIIMQGISDIQMHKYRKNRTSTFIRVGLWRYSRHPNYLGEILMWWGIALSVFSACPYVLLLFTGALLNTLLFLFVSIPLAEGKQSEKEGFSEYKKQTRVLFPIKKVIKRS